MSTRVQSNGFEFSVLECLAFLSLLGIPHFLSASDGSANVLHFECWVIHLQFFFLISSSRLPRITLSWNGSQTWPLIFSSSLHVHLTLWCHQWLFGVPFAAQISCIRQTTPPATPSAHFLLLKPSPGHEYGHVRIKLMNQIPSVTPYITFSPSILWQMPHPVLNCSPPVPTAMPAISPVTAPVLWSAQLLWEEALLPCFQGKSGSSVF